MTDLRVILSLSELTRTVCIIDAQSYFFSLSLSNVYSSTRFGGGVAFEKKFHRDFCPKSFESRIKGTKGREMTREGMIFSSPNLGDEKKISTATPRIPYYLILLRRRCIATERSSRKSQKYKSPPKESVRTVIPRDSSAGCDRNIPRFSTR